MAARDDIASPLELFLLQLADDRNCLTDDLAVALYRAAESYGLECYRRGAEAQAENAPTLVRARPASPAESQTMPVVRGAWEVSADAVTPIRPPAVVTVPRAAWPFRSTP
jgi:hypothetical protein